MGIPQRVAKEAAEAEAALQQLASTNVPPSPAPAAPAEPTPVEAVEPVPAAPAEPTPAAPAAPAATPTSAETELQRLQQQLSTQAGRNNAQEAELIELRARMQTMQEMMARQPAAPAPTPAAPAPNLITDADRTDFGEDMIDFVQRAARQQFGSQLDTLLNKVTAMEGQLRQVTQTAQTARQSAEEIAAEKYFGYLDTQVPGWRVTNDDPGFVDWLGNRDTFSRKTRHELLTSAHAEADAQTVAEFFRAYWQETGVSPANPPAPTAPSSAPATPTVDPASLVAPTPANAPTPSVNPRGGKVWTQAEVEKVYDDRMKKRISQEEFDRLEKEIEAAVLEGRVQ